MIRSLVDSLLDGMHRLAGQPVSLRRIAALHGRSAQGALLVMLSIPCMLPVPGVGMVLSFGIASLAWTMWRGRQTLVLPWRVGRFQLPPHAAARVLVTLASVYRWAARLCRMRWSTLACVEQRRWMAPLVALMALLIFLPIPFGNLLPSLSLALLGLGLMFRDGVMVMLSAATAVLAAAFVALLAIVGVELGSWLTNWVSAA